MVLRHTVTVEWIFFCERTFECLWKCFWCEKFNVFFYPNVVWVKFEVSFFSFKMFVFNFKGCILVWWNHVFENILKVIKVEKVKKTRENVGSYFIFFIIWYRNHWKFFLEMLFLNLKKRLALCPKNLGHRPIP